MNARNQKRSKWLEGLIAFLLVVNGSPSAWALSEMTGVAQDGARRELLGLNEKGATRADLQNANQELNAAISGIDWSNPNPESVAKVEVASAKVAQVAQDIVGQATVTKEVNGLPQIVEVTWPDGTQETLDLSEPANAPLRVAKRVLDLRPLVTQVNRRSAPTGLGVPEANVPQVETSVMDGGALKTTENFAAVEKFLRRGGRVVVGIFPGETPEKFLEEGDVAMRAEGKDYLFSTHRDQFAFVPANDALAFAQDGAKKLGLDRPDQIGQIIVRDDRPGVKALAGWKNVVVVALKTIVTNLGQLFDGTAPAQFADISGDTVALQMAHTLGANP